MKKLSIIGKGTAGALAVNYFSYYTDYEIDLYFDSSKQPQTVGEGSQLDLLSHLHQTLNMSWHEVNKHFDAHVKKGINYVGWKKDFVHHLPMPYTSLHFNAVKLQEYLLYVNRKKINIIDKQVTHDTIDSDFIMDCSGTPTAWENNYNKAKYIPVNAGLVRHYMWESPEFDYTQAIARPYGWIFGIPLQSRVSYGYMYNKKINNIDDIKEDFAMFEKEKKLKSFSNESSLEFKNYYRQENFNERVSYNGNSSFFLEPLEATSINAMLRINYLTLAVQTERISLEEANTLYRQDFKEYQDIITLHYFGGSQYKTDFWKHATELATECMKNFPEIKYILNLPELAKTYGSWNAWNFKENVYGLNLYENLLELHNE